MQKRQFPSFITAFREFLGDASTPEIYIKWASIWILSATLERRVWCVTRKRMVLYPNLFIMLAGPPATGKGYVIQPARSLVNGLGPNRTSASSMTSASLVDDLRAADRSIIIPGQQSIDYNCLNVCSPEFQVLFPAYDVAILAKVTDIFDCQGYGETRRGGKGDNSFHLDRPCITMLGGTTPEHFFGTFPDAAFRTGFMSRMVIVWGDDRDPGDFIPLDEEDSNTDTKMWAALAKDLKDISQYYGRFWFESDAREAFREFYYANPPYGGDPIPSHPRLQYYAARRDLQIAKLMMIHAADRGEGRDTMRLSLADYTWAYETLIEAEAEMPRLFDEVNQGGHQQIISDIHHELWLLYVKHKKPIPKPVLSRLLSARAKAFEHEPIIKVMISGGWIRAAADKKLGQCYIPLSSVPTDQEVKMK